MTRTAITPIGLALMLGFTLASSAPGQSPRDLMSDTWVATDGLGRSLPGTESVGTPRKGKAVGVFYFLWLGRHGDAGPFDIARILARDPEALKKPKSPLWGPELAPHHWGESIFGYYVSDDDAVIRKHAQMLADADVDMITFDVTNQATYPESWKALCRVYDAMKREGNRVPQIAFLCPFGDPQRVVHTLWAELYGKNLYPDLWYRWEGKPLILADPDRLGSGLEQGRRASPTELASGHTLGQIFTADKPFRAVGLAAPTWENRNSAVTISLFQNRATRKIITTHRFANVSDNAWLTLEIDNALPAGTYELVMSEPSGKIGWWSNPEGKGGALADGKPVEGDRTLQIRPADSDDDAIRRFFTFRKPQPDYFVGPTGPNQWGWLEVTPQHAFYKTKGVPEEVAVGVGQNAAEGKLSVFTYPPAHGRSFHDGKEPGPEGRDMSGRNFAEQWRRALEIDPAFIFVTNWNEWIAGRFSPANMPLHGTGPVTFVDEFDTEFSRDIEPMKGGHTDNFYYQMISNIRRYKGVRPIPPVTPGVVTIDGKFADWSAVGPEFRDTIGDPMQRDFRGWGQGMRYVNRTGRNDIVTAKASIDATNVSFHVQTKAPLSPPTGNAWMLLYLDVDQNEKTGWMGYDYLVNRRPGEGKTTLERNVGGRDEWVSHVDVPMRHVGDSLELAIPLKALGLTGRPRAIDFKWADNTHELGDWSDFTRNGDAAPNDRYNYRAKFPVSVPERR